MNKKIALILIMLVFTMVGCDQVEQIKDTYLQTRVAQLLTQMPSPSPKVIEVTPTVPLPTLAPTATSVTVTEIPATTPEATLVPTYTPITTPDTTAEPKELTTVPTLTSSDPGIYLGDPSWKDPFENNKGWAVDTDNYSSVSIANGVMSLVSLSTIDAWRLAPTDSLTNAYIEAAFTPETCAMDDHFGLIFRVPVLAEADRGYLFGLTCDGRYSLRKFDGKVGEKGVMDSLVPWTADLNIIPGANHANRVGVMTMGDRLIMFINGARVGEVKDTSYLQGFFGVFIGSKVTKNFSVKVDNAAVWSNPTLP